jgi:Alpha/beta hydrolase family
MQNNVRIILMHGAGLGSFIWDEIKPLIIRPTLAVDFPNRGRAESKTGLKLSLDDYTNNIIDVIRRSKDEKLIFVTHSISGCVGLKLADYFDNQVIGFVAIGSAIPGNGNSYFSCFPPLQAIIMKLLIRLLGTTPPANIIMKSLCNNLTQEQSENIVQKFTPESTALYFDKCHAEVPEVKKMYVKLLDDKAFSLANQENSIKNLRPQSIVELRSGHLPMISHPKKLAEMLNEFIDSCIQTPKLK